MAEVKKINGYSLNDETSRANIGCNADTYSNARTYKVGDIVVRDKQIYKCKTEITTAEAFDSEKWQQICLRDLVIGLKEELADETVTIPIIPRLASTKFTGTLICRRFGKVVTLYASGEFAAGSQGMLILDGNLPEEFWPLQNVVIRNNNGSFYLTVQSTGAVGGGVLDEIGTSDISFKTQATYIVDSGSSSSQDIQVSEEFIERTLAALETLEQENVEQQDKIENLQSEIDILNSEFADNTVSGESAIVSDGVTGSKVETVIDGNTYQETTEGYNLADLSNYGTQIKNGVTVTENKDGSFNATGTGTSNYITFKVGQNLTDKLEDGEQYTLWTNNNNELMYIQMTCTKADGSNPTYYSTSLKNTTFTVNKSTYSKYTLNFQSGGSSKDAVYDLKNMQFMLFKGATIPPYEPYTNGASPNTEYEQDIEVITECSLVQRGKNECNITEVYPTIYSSGLPVNKNATDYVTINNFDKNNIGFTIKQNTYAMALTNLIKLKPNTKYIASFDREDINYTGTSKRQFIYNYNNNSYTVNVRKDAEVKEIEFTTDNTGVIAIGFGYNNDCMGATCNISNLQISTIGGDFEPYIEPIVHSIDLAGNSLAKVGDIKDLLNIGMNGSVSIEKSMNKYVFTGNEEMITSSKTTVKRYVAKNVLSTNLSVKNSLTNDTLCNYFNTISPNASDADNLGLAKYNDTGFMFNLPLDTEYSTVELFKAMLKEKYDSGKPLYIDYVLAEPTTIDLPSISPIKLFEGTNIFELVTNLGTTLSVTYKVSNNSRLEALEKAVLSLGANV